MDSGDILMHETHDGNGLKTNIVGLYNRVAATYGQVGPERFAYAGRHLVEDMGISDGARVLDVAVGRGANLFPAAERVGPRGQVIGIDLAENMVQETKAEIERRNILHATVLQMDAEHLAFDTASFDDVLCGFAIFLFPHLEQALAEFYRVLCSGGKMGITVAQEVDALSLWYGKRLTEYSEQYHFPLRVGGGPLNLSDIPLYLARTGFVNVRVLREKANFIYADAQQYWDAKWTHGTRYSLEHMSLEVLEQFKSEVFAELEEAQSSGGIHEELDLRYIIATR
jgi:O-methyltransferase/aklanonic acid methyltransferase